MTELRAMQSRKAPLLSGRFFLEQNILSEASLTSRYPCHVILLATQFLDHISQSLRQRRGSDVAANDEYRSICPIHDFARDIPDRVMAPGIANRPRSGHHEIVIAELDFGDDLLNNNSAADLHDRRHAGTF